MPISPFLPEDLYTGTLVTRIWNPAGIGGPSVAVIREDAVYDLSGHVATMSALLEAEEPVVWVRSWAGYRVGTLEEVLANSTEATRDPAKAYFLSPCDLQVIKAAGVTFATSMIERVIEEKAGRQGADAVGKDIGQDIDEPEEADGSRESAQRQGDHSFYFTFLFCGHDISKFNKPLPPIVADQSLKKRDAATLFRG